MGRAAGVKRRRRQKIRVQNPSKLKKKAMKKPKITCPQINQAWDEKKTIQQNIESMGLSSNPNKTIKMKGSKKPHAQPPKPDKLQVAVELEEEATMPRESKMKLPNDVVKFCVHMLENYGEDYEAMSKDRKNYYQKTPGQIRKEINKLKKIPIQWNAYLRAKEAAKDTEMEVQN